MKDNYTCMVFVLDSSGSMSAIKEPTIAGFNGFLDEQRKLPGDVSFTLVNFNTEVEIKHNFIPLSDVPYLSEDNYKPFGWTALLDAIGITINSTGERLAKMSENERPARVLIVVKTDGLENRSKMFDSNKIREMITHQTEKYNWQFIFMGASKESILAAEKYGFSKENRILYQAEEMYVGPAIASASSLVSSKRLCSVSDMSNVGFTDEDRKKQEKV